MYIIAGLGNPGSNYKFTRHNIGFLFLDEIAHEDLFELNKKFNAYICKSKLQKYECILVKPQSFMNLSGQSIKLIMSYFKVKAINLIVICDDLDQNPGAVKMRIGGGHGGHNGLRNILENISDNNFCRIKIGIGKPLYKSATATWVLQEFSSAELQYLQKESFPIAKNRILNFLQAQHNG